MTHPSDLDELVAVVGADKMHSMCLDSWVLVGVEGDSDMVACPYDVDRKVEAADIDRLVAPSCLRDNKTESLLKKKSHFEDFLYKCFSNTYMNPVEFVLKELAYLSCCSKPITAYKTWVALVWADEIQHIPQ
jgi:hypothetical protein